MCACSTLAQVPAFLGFPRDRPAGLGCHAARFPSEKVAFMTQTAIELDLANVKAHAARVEQFVAHTPFDVVIARAFSALAAFVRCSARHLAPGGRLVAMKGIYPEEELATLPPDIGVLAITALTVPGLAAERHLVVLEHRDSSTRAPR